ncbi:hypothetical protein Poli38472_013299 [Pythium oligandrum]|uniref:Uncharacterized protein n=1 Tax=Pythium oligandrum TaxID=41045 RepID=A0A8K1FE11_PYTOL|nr:hypothetical protein Poli38472_013299 [Pythium oligandrum]|eukprot:TMW55408.1 hypothetical protein Poli38472_013299 [Pythium oligandrum]
MADDLQSSEELAFVAEEVDRIILAAIESSLKDEVYDELQVAQWIDTICETIMKGLSELRKPLKYVVSCLIMQKNGAGLHSSISCHWDTVTDGAHVVKWPSDKHKDHNRSMMHPFDARRSGKQAFPSFDAAMAMSKHEDDENEELHADNPLDWSIDTIAELRPTAMTPSTEQKQGGHALQTPSPASFFEDEAHFRVLQTPAHVRVTETMTPLRWQALHRRCAETIEYCDARVRERQEKLQRLVIPASKLKHKLSRQRAPSRSPLTPRTSGGGAWDLSPIPLATQEKKRQRLAPKTPHKTKPSPAPMPLMTPSPGSFLSSIAEHADVLTPSFASLTFSPSPIKDPDDEEKEERENDANTLNASSLTFTPSPNKPTSSSSPPSGDSLGSISLLRDGSDASPASTASPPTTTSTCSVVVSTPGKELSIPQRQATFLAAMEEEARAFDATRQQKQETSVVSDAETASSSTSSSVVLKKLSMTPPRRSPPATTIASMYKEAKELGLSEPSAQWEYVQLLRRKANAPRTSLESPSGTRTPTTR